MAGGPDAAQRLREAEAVIREIAISVGDGKGMAELAARVARLRVQVESALGALEIEHARRAATLNVQRHWQDWEEMEEAPDGSWVRYDDVCDALGAEVKD